jgi:hypothetical protein
MNPIPPPNSRVALPALLAAFAWQRITSGHSQPWLDNILDEGGAFPQRYNFYEEGVLESFVEIYLQLDELPADAPCRFEITHESLFTPDMVSPHPCPWVRPLFAAYKAFIDTAFAGFYQELFAWLEGRRYGMAERYPLVGGFIYRGCLIPYARIAECCRRMPDAWEEQDYADVCKLLFSTYLPSGQISYQVRTYAFRAWQIGMAQVAWENAHPGREATDAEVAAFCEDLAVMSLDEFFEVEREETTDLATVYLNFIEVDACMVEKLKDAFWKIADHCFTPLFGSAYSQVRFSVLTQDVHQLAVDILQYGLCEISELKQQGFIFALPLGTRLQRQEDSGGCLFCRNIDGAVLTVVDPDQPDKDRWHDVWLGKTNRDFDGLPAAFSGRGVRHFKEVPAGNIFPHFRAKWRRLS